MKFSDLRSTVVKFLSRNLGHVNVLRIDFDSDFVAGNIFNGEVRADTKNSNGATVTGTPETFDSVSFDTDQATTLALVAKSIQKTASVLSVQKISARSLLVTGTNKGATLTLSATVTGGSGQPIATMTEIQAPIWVKINEESTSLIDSQHSAPKYPYATYRVDSPTAQSTGGFEKFDSETDLPLHSKNYEATIVVNYYGDDAIYELYDAHRALRGPTTSSLFGSKGLAVRQAGPVRNLSSLLEVSFEPRASFDFNVGIRDSWFEDYSTINTVGLEMTVDEDAVFDGKIGE